jgi:Arc/MetJ-type ribon-helix-helix transcriptional regulator
MQAFSVEVPDKIALELDQLVADGWFASQSEVIRLALLEFIRRHQFALIEQFQREDIKWALQQHKEQKQ